MFGKLFEMFLQGYELIYYLYFNEKGIIMPKDIYKEIYKYKLVHITVIVDPYIK